MNGYLYRVCPANATRIRELVRDFVGAGGWCFGGAAAWDFDPERGRDNLRPIELFHDADALNCDGDFGQAFSPQAEVRWKRRDDGSYDVLVLSERELAIADASEIIGPWEARSSDKLAVVQSGDARPIGYVGYYAPNGALQFTRYSEVRA